MARLFFDTKNWNIMTNPIFFMCGQHKEQVVFVEIYQQRLFHRIRSPPSNLNFKKFQIGGKDMENNRPKRRKDKYNPYTLNENAGQYYVSFKDGQGVL